jgi:hypothetical protein
MSAGVNTEVTEPGTGVKHLSEAATAHLNPHSTFQLTIDSLVSEFMLRSVNA